ncbi:hypothetical protein SAMN04489832_2343 [Micromonospora cremea]|uniref:Uncharacterized protein n=1 Tax=Micromonospora cremea TaxID=709881 RepID=A0A1N5WDV5_9ACTN|nr:hypothetical protein SAMN04489832_2343 [Micromonospora cremea]
MTHLVGRVEGSPQTAPAATWTAQPDQTCVMTFLPYEERVFSLSSCMR